MTTVTAGDAELSELLASLRSFSNGSEDDNRRLRYAAADHLAAANAELAERPDWPTVNATYEKWKARAEAAEARIASLTEERDLVLKAVLYHFGPEGAAKVTGSALEARAALNPGDQTNG